MVLMNSGTSSVSIQLPTFDVGWRNWKVFADLFQQQILRAFLAHLFNGP